MNIFERAAREKIRFEFKGPIATEDLFDLSMVNLDLLYRDISTELKNQGGSSLVKDGTESEYTSLLQLQVDLIRHVFESKLEEQKATRAENIRRYKNKRIKELEEKSFEYLNKMLNVWMMKCKV